MIDGSQEVETGAGQRRLRQSHTVRVQLEDDSVVVLVEQNFYMASSVGDHFHIMDDGKVVRSGLMQELVEDEELQSRYLGISKTEE